jgi:hypothetical protein
MSTAERRERRLFALKAVHTLIWFSVESAMAYLLAAGIGGRSDRRAAVAAGVVGGETLIFLANGARCPLTQVAESLGAQRGSVTDLFLPSWLARSLPAIHVPLVLLAVVLHARNLRRRPSAQEGQAPDLPATTTSVTPAGAVRGTVAR